MLSSDGRRGERRRYQERQAGDDTPSILLLELRNRSKWVAGIERTAHGQATCSLQSQWEGLAPTRPQPPANSAMPAAGLTQFQPQPPAVSEQQQQQLVASALPAAAYSQSQPQPLVVLAQCQPQPAAVSEQQLAASAVSAVLVPAGVPPAPDLAPGWPEQVRDDTHAHTNCCGEKGKAQAQRREAFTRPTVHRSVR